MQFERKLSQAIINNIQDKDKMVANNDSAAIFRNIKEIKMNVESELEEVKRLRDQMSQDNNFS